MARALANREMLAIRDAIAVRVVEFVQQDFDREPPRVRAMKPTLALPAAEQREWPLLAPRFVGPPQLLRDDREVLHELDDERVELRLGEGRALHIVFRPLVTCGTFSVSTGSGHLPAMSKCQQESMTLKLSIIFWIMCDVFSCAPLETIATFRLRWSMAWKGCCGLDAR